MAERTGKTARPFSADEKLKILEEARQPGTTVAEVRRRYQLEGTTFYRWECEAKAAMRDALGGKARGGDARVRELEREVARLAAELQKKRQVISEVVEENLALAGCPASQSDRLRGALNVRTASRFSAEAKCELLALVARTRERTSWTIRRILGRLGLSKARYREWTKRAATGGTDRLADRPTTAPALDALPPEERRAVLDYALAHPKDEYRRLAWQMVDEDVAYLSPSSVYRVLAHADLLYRRKRSTGSGEEPARRRRGAGEAPARRRRGAGEAGAAA